jgi:hypothetical protein
VRAVSGANAVVVEKYSYDGFGGPTIYDSNDSQTSIGNPYMFTGRRCEHGIYQSKEHSYWDEAWQLLDWAMDLLKQKRAEKKK